MDDALASSFIATYYRLIYRSALNISKLYDQNAEIIRMVKSHKTKLKYDEDIIPFNIQNSIVKVKEFTKVNMLFNKVMISVMGSVIDNDDGGIEKNFHQQFILKKNEFNKWNILSDTFIDFELPKTDLIAASTPSTSLEKVKKPSLIRDAPATKRTTADEFDQSKTITIINLSRNYIGDDVKTLYSKFGNITKQFYTHNTIYLEYETVEMMENALRSKSPIYKGSYTKAIQGIVRKNGK